MIDKVELTNELFDNLDIENVVYAEYASGGAMGNSGGLMIYYASNGSLMLYETNVAMNPSLYKKATDILSGRCFNLPNFEERTGPDVFDYHYGGFGNAVFLNAHYLLGRTTDALLLIKGNNKYKIWCSVQGVFESVIHSLEKRTGKRFGITDTLDLRSIYQEENRKREEQRKERKEAREARDKALGSHIETVKAKYGEKFRHLIEIINKHDPIELIAIGCPEDEYVPEARTIIVQLKEGQTVAEIQTIVHAEFQHWFGMDLAGSKKNYHELAKDIFNWINKVGLADNK